MGKVTKLFQSITGFWIEEAPKKKSGLKPFEMRLRIEKGRGVVGDVPQGDYSSLNEVLQSRPAIPFGDDIATVGVRDNGTLVIMPNRMDKYDPVDTNIKVIPAEEPPQLGLTDREKRFVGQKTEGKQYMMVCGPADKEVVFLKGGRKCDPDDYDSVALGELEKALYRTPETKVWGIGTHLPLRRLALPD